VKGSTLNETQWGAKDAGLAGNESGHCIVALFSRTPRAIIALRCISLQSLHVIAGHCIVAIIACNDCNEWKAPGTPQKSGRLTAFSA
jgi:hypothetical protein